MSVVKAIAVFVIRVRFWRQKVIIPVAHRHVGNELFVQQWTVRREVCASGLRTRAGVKLFFFKICIKLSSTCLVELVSDRAHGRCANIAEVAKRVVKLAVLIIASMIQEHMFSFAHRAQVFGSENVFVGFALGFIQPVVDDYQSVRIPHFSLCHQTPTGCTP